MLHGLIAFWFHLLEQWHYLGIVVLMALESSIVPVPSEVVIPPAAYWASQGKMNFWGVVLAGTIGSWIGSAISYGVARWLERAIVGLGRSFGIRICAEGVETAAQLEVLRREGCEQAQGYLFGRAMEVVAIDGLVRGTGRPLVPTQPPDGHGSAPGGHVAAAAAAELVGL